MSWQPFSPAMGSVPPEGRLVLLQLAGANDGRAPSVVVGYVKQGSAGAYVVVPGVPASLGGATAWNDCLGDDFSAPLWALTQTISPRARK